VKIATFNINNVNKRLENLLDWLRDARPDVACADIHQTKSYRNNALVQREPRALFARFLDQGWIDAIRTLHPNAPMYTFWDYMRNRWQRDAGLRLDHLLQNPKAVRRLAKSGVDREVRG
jgi:exodeoxyribonuclease-3